MARAEKDAALAAKYDKASDAQKRKLFLKILADQDNVRANVHRVLGVNVPGWTQREARRLDLELPPTTRGRPKATPKSPTKEFMEAQKAAKATPAKKTTAAKKATPKSKGGTPSKKPAAKKPAARKARRVKKAEPQAKAS